MDDNFWVIYIILFIYCNRRKKYMKYWNVGFFNDNWWIWSDLFLVWREIRGIIIIGWCMMNFVILILGLDIICMW